MKIFKRTAVKAIFFYILFTFGIWTFLNTYNNFCIRLSGKETAPVNVVFSGDTAEIRVISDSFEFDISAVSPENKLFFILYMFSADELKADIVIADICERLRFIRGVPFSWN